MQYNQNFQWHIRERMGLDSKPKDEDDERWRLRRSKSTKTKSSWMFLAWAFVIAESLRFGGSQSWAATNDEQDETGSDLDNAGQNALSGQFDALASLDENEDSNGGDVIHVKLSSQANLELVNSEAFSEEILVGSSGQSDDNSSNSLLSPLDQATEESGSEFAPVQTADLGPPPPLPDFVFFDGLDGFASDIGLGSGFLSIIDAVDSSMQADVSLALSVANDAFAPVGIWSGLGEFDTDQGISGWDGFSHEWAVQATASIDGQSFELTSNSGLETISSEQYGSSDENVTGNELIAVDGQDWDGALWVSGNYYEFNTIVQLNILWDGDQVSATTEASEEGYLPNQILTGQNTQSNQAEILDSTATMHYLSDQDDSEQDAFNNDLQAPGRGTPARETDQLIYGGAETNNAVIQRNKIIDNDDVSHRLEGLIEDAGVSEPLGGGANVNSSGQTQENDSLLVTGAQESDGHTSPSGYSAYLNGLYDPTEITLIHGNYYEFNTIVQINIVSDIDEVNWVGNGAASGDVIASGGNIQLNQATLVHDDQQDNLFVGGTYSEYNMVLQVNALEDNDTIEQINSLIDTLLGTDHAGDGSPADQLNDQGEDGEDGLGSDDVNVSLPNVLDDLVYQNPSLDAFI